MTPSPPILLVDDDENDVLLTQLALQAVGLPNSLVVVRNGNEAVRYLSGDGFYGDRTWHPMPGPILLDLHMPMLTGFDFLEWRQCHRVTPKPRCSCPDRVFESSRHSEGDVARLC